MKYKLVEDTIDKNDINYLIEWLSTYPRLTKGEITVQFEKKWANWQNINFSTFVNSGSSANLLMLYSLIETNRISIGDKVVVPAISWATDLAPVFQFGLEPVLCDCNMEDLSIDIQHFREIIATHKPKVLLLVSVLGLVPQMDEIVDLCEKNNIILLEDTCESLGSKYNNQLLGNFGLMSSFSLYFGHHISTIEGGIISTNDPSYDRLLKSLRNHGWDRDWDDDNKARIRQEHNVSDFDALYTFYYSGFNVRSTDLQAHLGLRQIDKIPNFVNLRERNYRYYLEFLSDDLWKPVYREGTYISSFCFPIIDRNRNLIVDKCRKEGIEIRPLICGSMGKQPFFTKRYGQVELKNADIISDYGMYIPNNPTMNKDDIRHISNIINEVAKGI